MIIQVNALLSLRALQIVIFADCDLWGDPGE